MNTQDWNQSFDKGSTYQVWVTSWPEDGSGKALEGEASCTRYHANVILVGQFDKIEDAVGCVMANQSYEPRLTKHVTWRTDITDITEARDGGSQ